MACLGDFQRRIRFLSLVLYDFMNSFIMVKTRYESTRVDLNDVLIIERRLRKIFLVTTERLFSFYEKIVFIDPLLGDNFYEVIDGCFVNFDRTLSAKEGKLRFDNGYEFPLSERSFAKAKKHHYAYLRLRQLRNIKNEQLTIDLEAAIST